MKIQSYTRLSSEKISLVNVAIDASSFLPRQPNVAGTFTTQDFPQMVVAHILPAPLDHQNTIELDSKDEPVVIAGRHPPFSNSNPDVQDLRNLTQVIVDVIQDRLSMKLRPTDPDETDGSNITFKPLELGGVAHELGTIPLKSESHPDGLLDPNLKLLNRDGVYVCDLSIFPYSPEVNPTLTLVALALRLSRFIHPRIPVRVYADHTVYVMNQTGEDIKIFVSNHLGVWPMSNNIADNTDTGDIAESPGGLTILSPGEILSCNRSSKLKESVMVYRLNLNSKNTYQSEPLLYVATPGKLCIVD